MRADDRDDGVFAERRSKLMAEIRASERGISEAVLAAVERVERHRFVRPENVDEAYENRPLPIGEGQTISQPLIVAMMTEALGISPGDRVLEIGTGSGYQRRCWRRWAPRFIAWRLFRRWPGGRRRTCGGRVTRESSSERTTGISVGRTRRRLTGLS